MTIQRRQRASKSGRRDPFESAMGKTNKSRKWCPGCMGQKLHFATEDEALSFIAQCSPGDFHKGYAPNRAYFCDECRAWHVTSKTNDDERSFASMKTVVELYAPEWQYIRFEKDAGMVVIKTEDGAERWLFPEEVLQHIVSTQKDVLDYRVEKNENRRYVLEMEKGAPRR